MIEVTVISGKGGTGKTTLTAAFASLAQNAVLADCDVDAADLHIILDPHVEERRDFMGLKLAIKDEDKCIDCGRCLEHCRFSAITEDYEIVRDSCEGCAVCQLVCPEDAISMVDRLSGEAFISSTRFGPMVHASLMAGEEASGKLVAMVREMARKVAKNGERDLILIDGPPGIGCPVIAAISGVSMVLVVTEPTLSGMHDLERVLGVAEHFGIPSAVIVNKADINEDNTNKIRTYCSERDIPVLGQLAYHGSATESMIKGQTLIEHADNPLAPIIKDMWNKMEEILNE